MLSDDLKRLAREFRSLRAEHQQVVLGPEVLDELAEDLTAYAEIAEGMEAQPVPNVARLTSEHLEDSNVTLFPIVPRSAPAPEQGGAA